MNQQNSTINKKIQVLDDGAILGGYLLGFCTRRDVLGTEVIFGIVQKEDGWLADYPVHRIKITDDVTTGWQPIETAPRDGTEIDVWVTNIPPEAMRVTNVKYDKEKSCFVYWDNRYAEYRQVIGDITHWMPIPRRPLK